MRRRGRCGSTGSRDYPAPVAHRILPVLTYEADRLVQKRENHLKAYGLAPVAGRLRLADWEERSQGLRRGEACTAIAAPFEAGRLDGEPRGGRHRGPWRLASRAQSCRDSPQSDSRSTTTAS